MLGRIKKTYKDLHNFSFLKELKKGNHFSHGVFSAKKTKNGNEKSQWYAKCLGGNRNEAILETLAQEFYRLILIQQPKTRRAISEIKTGKYEYYVLSKEIPYFNDTFFLYPEKSNEQILNNRITGLAATQVLALWLNEVDFKAGNVGVNEDRKVIKIDGGLSFITLNPDFSHLHQRNFNITKEDLEALPNLVNYEACNWLHLVQWSLEKEHSIKTEPTELDKRINQSPHFKNELYRTLLRIISLPNQLIQFFTQNYITKLNDVKIFSDFMIARKQQLAWAAQQIPAFNEYRRSNKAQKEMLDFLSYLRTFKTMEKYVLLSEFKKKYNVNIEEVILGDIIKEYIPIKNFAIELDNYHYLKPLNFTIDFDTEKFNLDMSLENCEKIIPDIISLKKIISEYLNSPTIFKKRALYSKLSDIVETIKKEPIIENPFISDLIESINKVFYVNDNLKNTPLPSMGFFNPKYREMSAVYLNTAGVPPSHDFTFSY